MVTFRTRKLKKKLASKKVIIRTLCVALSCLLCLLSSALIPSAIAHSTGQSYIYFQIGEDTLSAHVSTPIEDLNEVLELGLPAEKKIQKSDIEPLLDNIIPYIEKHTEITCRPQNCAATFTNQIGINNTSSGQFLQLFYTIDGFQTLPEAVSVKYDVLLVDRPYFTNFILVDNNWRTGTFNEEANILGTYEEVGQIKTLDLTKGSLLKGLTTIVKLGFTHIIEGIDHVLFIVALLLPAAVRRENGKWKPVDSLSSSLIYIVKVATAFTIAHSITLALATLQIVDLPSRLVESVIAASIGLAAIDIFYPIFRKRIWLIIFIFGLFHGFGFASVLGELGVTSQNAFLSLLAFNVGIELGQLAIVAVVFPILYLIRKQRFYSHAALKAGALLLGAVSLYWLIERVFNVNLQVLPTVQGLFA